MGPVMALTFGMTLGEPHMIKMGLRNECISLTVCIVTGFVVGLAYVAGFQNFYCWPTEQMSGRGQAVGLIDGAIIAAVSGVGVALCVMGDYAATIIGVAISASLLPPAVNCGMMLAFALYELLVEGNSTSSLYSAGKCPQFEGHTAGKLAEMAMLSFALTLENIVCVATRFLSYSAPERCSNSICYCTTGHYRHCCPCDVQNQEGRAGPRQERSNVEDGD